MQFLIYVYFYQTCIYLYGWYNMLVRYVCMYICDVCTFVDVHEYRVSHHIILIYVTVIIFSENYFKNAQRDTIILL